MCTCIKDWYLNRKIVIMGCIFTNSIAKTSYLRQYIKYFDYVICSFIFKHFSLKAFQIWKYPKKLELVKILNYFVSAQKELILFIYPKKSALQSVRLLSLPFSISTWPSTGHFPLSSRPRQPFPASPTTAGKARQIRNIGSLTD